MPTSHRTRWTLAALAAPLMLSALACGPSVRYGRPQTPLERAIVLVERDDRGGVHALSAADTSARTAERVPSPAPVDINSRVDIAVDRGRLAGRAAPELADRLDDASTRAETLRGVLDQLAAYLEARGRLVELYRSMPAADRPAPRAAWRDDFADAKRASARAESDFIRRVTELWPADRAVRRMAAAVTSSPDFKEYVQAEIADAEAAYGRLLDAVREGGYRLRLTATLVDDHGNRSPIHLPGYDSIPEGRLATVDRWGLDMTDAQRAEYAAATEARNRMLAAAEAVRTGERSIEEALAGVLSAELDGAAGLAARAAELGRALRPDRLAARLDSTAAAVDALEADVRRATGETLFMVFPGRSALPPALAALDSALDAATASATAVADAAASLSNQRAALAAAVDGAIRGDPAPLRTALQTLADTAAALVSALPDPASFTADFDGIPALADFAGAADADARAVRALWADSDARRRLEEWRALAAAAVDLKDRAAALLDVVAGAPVAGDPVSVPAASFDVPLEDARDTWLDLRRTPRTRGDRVEVRAEVLGSGAANGEYVATLDVERLGFHARLEPGLALVAPHGARPAGTALFRFAPLLSWVQTWTPRPDRAGPVASFFRATGLYWGIHAASLDFNPANSLEIGLGATAGIWDGALLAGAGYNLMSTDAGVAPQGGVYYVIGSNLIALLQRLGGE